MGYIIIMPTVCLKSLHARLLPIQKYNGHWPPSTGCYTGIYLVWSYSTHSVHRQLARRAALIGYNCMLSALLADLNTFPHGCCRRIPGGMREAAFDGLLSRQLHKETLKVLQRHLSSVTCKLMVWTLLSRNLTICYFMSYIISGFKWLWDKFLGQYPMGQLYFQSGLGCNHLQQIKSSVSKKKSMITKGRYMYMSIYFII